MISDAEHPVEWAMLTTELDDAREHLESLINEMTKAGLIDEADYAVQLGHVCAHLNRAWNSRSLEGEISEDEWEMYSQFPKDLQPVG
jgi:hypothetical protein